MKCVYVEKNLYQLTCTGTYQCANYCNVFRLIRHQAVHTTAILSKLLDSLCKVRANCTVLFTNCSTVLCTGQKCVKYVKRNIPNSIPSVGPMFAQLLCVQSFLLMWKKGIRKQIFVEFCIFHFIRLYMMAHCIRSYCNFRLECTFTLNSVIYILN
jgi:hypothetical protein